MFDDQSFDTQAFSVDSWLFDLVAVAAGALRTARYTLVVAPAGYLYGRVAVWSGTLRSWQRGRDPAAHHSSSHVASLPAKEAQAASPVMTRLVQRSSTSKSQYRSGDHSAKKSRRS